MWNSYVKMVELDDFGEQLARAISHNLCLICGGSRVMDEGVCLGCLQFADKEVQEAIQKVRDTYEVLKTVRKKVTETYKAGRRFEASLTLSKLKWGDHIYNNVKLFLCKEYSRDYAEPDFKEMIENYETVSREQEYTEEYTRELFTWEEIEAMRECFKKSKEQQVFDYSGVKLPLPKGTIPLIMPPCNESHHRVLLREFNKYPLEFEVCGYFNLY